MRSTIGGRPIVSRTWCNNGGSRRRVRCIPGRRAGERGEMDGSGSRASWGSQVASSVGRAIVEPWKVSDRLVVIACCARRVGPGRTCEYVSTSVGG